ncbi:hypothetical protein QAD02_009368 [Eretmocerus hayati]|uniref:Uncharacterized protein n=1 Tax=Eretmocerus hayati TaxID=131215 RepID=A0ACC2N963_9HYME|nr:hypothetical protein QAD02_009368 [Eretmocerus hayati]
MSKTREILQLASSILEILHSDFEFKKDVGCTVEISIRYLIRQLIPQRWVTVFVIFFGTFNIYSMRTFLPLIITEMVQTVKKNEKFMNDACTDGHNQHNTFVEYNQTLAASSNTIFQWSEKTQGIILSSFYWTYIFTNILGGMLVERYGGKRCLGITIFLTSTLTLISPISIQWGGSTAFICLRALSGLIGGMMHSSIGVLAAQWIPLSERTRGYTFVLAGQPLGSVFGITVSGLILQYVSDGWPIVFYFFGCIGLLSFFINWAFCYDTPHDNPFITESEAQYLKENIRDVHKNKSAVPWRSILTSGPIWALLILLLGKNWALSTMSNGMPKYLSSVLKFSVRDNAFFTSLPHLGTWLIGFFTSPFIDSLITKRQMGVTQVRKMSVTFSTALQGVFVVLMSYAGCHGALVVTFFTISTLLRGFSYSSSKMNVRDLAPNYVGVITGFIMGIQNLSAIISPYVMGIMTENQTMSEWSSVFWLTFLVLFITNVIYLILGSGELQKWNDPTFLKDKVSDGINVTDDVTRF